MPSKKQYNLVQNDDYDTRIPLHTDEAFQHGITFQAKYIGTLDVPRPTSRVEIVAAMRRIRYEFKAKGIKKKKVTIDVSVDGVRVTMRKKKKKKQWVDENNAMLMLHPVYRIFYVSHDSQDLKIFSYIARDGASNSFKCNVFKSNKKSQAMRIVRTVGQAFEVCHKLSITGPSPEDDERDALMADVDAAGSERDSEIISDKQRKDTLSDPLSCDTLAADDTASLHDAHSETALTTSTPLPQAQGQAQSQPAQAQAQRPLRLDILPPPPNNSTRRSPMSGGETYTSPMTEPLRHTSDTLPTAGTPLSSHHEMQLLREQLEQQAQQTQAAVAQVHLLRDQLAAETAARLEAQARTHQLLVHNKELLDHITALVAHLQDQERLHQRQHGQGQNQHGVTMMPQQMSILCDPQTPSMAPAYLPDFQEIDALSQLIQHQQQAPLIENRSSYLPPLPGSPQQRQSMLQHQNSTPGIFTFGFPTTPEQQFQQQLLQRLQTLGGYPAPGRPQSQFNMYQSPSATIGSLYQPQLQQQQQQQQQHQHQQQPQQQSQQQQMQNISPTQVGLRVSQASSYSGSPVLTRPHNTSMADSNHGDSNDEPVQFIRPLSQNLDTRVCGDDGDSQLMFDSLGSGSKQRAQNQTETSPTASGKLQSQQLAAALSSMGSLRVSGHPEEGAAVVGRRGGGLTNGPPYVGAITRSTSEKVPNRSELMSQVQRTAWARHTTK